MRQVTKLRIEADAPVPYQIDGDVGGWLPVDVEILRGRMRLLVPASFAEKLRVTLPTLTSTYSKP